MGGPPGPDEVTTLDGRNVLTDPERPAVPCLSDLLAVSEDRDGFELELARLAHERRIPCLGICRGMQVMNVALGGSLYRDLYNCGVTERGHRQEPPYDRTIDHVAAGLLVSARSGDRVVEAVEDPHLPFYLGVQWHPEYLDRCRGLFNALAAAGERFAAQRKATVSQG